MGQWQSRSMVTLAFLMLGAGLASPTPADVESFDGIPAGVTAEGHPYLGSADAAVVLEEWSDYLCPYCGRHFHATYPELLERYVRPGKVRLVFRDFPLDGLHPTSARGHMAARCAAEQGAAKFWEMHRQLFTRQSEWSRLRDPAAFLADMAQAIGLDPAAYAACMNSEETAATIATSVEAGRALGYNGTPSFRFLGAGDETAFKLEGAQPLERFSRIADPLLAGGTPPEEPKPQRPELPLWARPEGLAPDLTRPGYNVAGDAYKGNPAAELVVIEFTDFQCPACRRHSQDVQPAIDGALIDTGKVLWVSKHLPLSMHPYAPIAAAAAECAGDQGQYWAMREAMFADVERWATDRAERELTRLAAALGLRPSAFQNCLAGRRALERVLADLYDAQNVVRTTPSFIVVENGRGSLLQPLPAEQFVNYLTQRLERQDSTRVAEAD